MNKDLDLIENDSQLMALVGSDTETKNVSMLKIPRDLFLKTKRGLKFKEGQGRRAGK